MSFFARVDEVVCHTDLVVDRPRGSTDPRRPGARLPLDHGYLAGTTAIDRAGIDVLIGSSERTGVVGALLTAQQSADEQADPAARVGVTLLMDCTEDEIETARAYVEQVLGAGSELVLRPSGWLARLPVARRG